MHVRSSWKIAPLLLILLLTMSGCVYWRLYTFRAHLSHFLTYFQVETIDDRPAITALQPVLRSSDLRWLTGLTPSAVEEKDEGTVSQYRFVGQTTWQDAEFNIDALVHYQKDRLTAFLFPPRFAQLITEENFIDVFGEMEQGRVDRFEQATDWSWAERAVHIPKRSDVLRYLGPTSFVASSNESFVLTYRYQLVGMTESLNPTGSAIFMQYEFEPTEERLVAADVYLGRLRISATFQPEKNTMKIKRL